MADEPVEHAGDLRGDPEEHRLGGGGYGPGEVQFAVPAELPVALLAGGELVEHGVLDDDPRPDDGLDAFSAGLSTVLPQWSRPILGRTTRAGRSAWWSHGHRNGADRGRPDDGPERINRNPLSLGAMEPTKDRPDDAVAAATYLGIEH
jgi:hypothetical protein